VKVWHPLLKFSLKIQPKFLVSNTVTYLEYHVLDCDVCEITRPHIPEDSILYSYGRENIKSRDALLTPFRGKINMPRRFGRGTCMY
jgi:hypothetical protein